MKILLTAAGLALRVFLADRVLLGMEWKGSIDYRRTHPGQITSGPVGPAFLAIQGLFEPERRHAAKEQTALRMSRDDRSCSPPEGEGPPGA